MSQPEDLDYMPGWSEAGLTRRDLTEAHPVLLHAAKRVGQRLLAEGASVAEASAAARLVLLPEDPAADV